MADQKWVENLIDSYQELQAMAVGGKILPLWLPAKPAYFPEELYWLVGATYKGFAEDAVVEVRNVFASNMSFRKEVFMSRLLQDAASKADILPKCHKH